MESTFKIGDKVNAIARGCGNPFEAVNGLTVVHVKRITGSIAPYYRILAQDGGRSVEGAECFFERSVA